MASQSFLSALRYLRTYDVEITFIIKDLRADDTRSQWQSIMEGTEKERFVSLLLDYDLFGSFNCHILAEKRNAFASDNPLQRHLWRRGNSIPIKWTDMKLIFPEVDNMPLKYISTPANIHSAHPPSHLTPKI